MASNASTRQSNTELPTKSAATLEIPAEVVEVTPPRPRARRANTTKTNGKTDSSTKNTKAQASAGQKSAPAADQSVKPKKSRAKSQSAATSKPKKSRASKSGAPKSAMTTSATAALRAEPNPPSSSASSPNFNQRDNDEPLPPEELLALASVQKLIQVGKERGNVNRADLALAFKDDQLNIENDFDGVLTLLREEEIPLGHTGPKTTDRSEKSKRAPDSANDDAGSDDPVRVYLREMGQVSLLTREGEVEIAKRIEVAVDAHLAALTGNAYCLRRVVEVGEFVRDGKLELKKAIDGLDDEDAPPEEEMRF